MVVDMLNARGEDVEWFAYTDGCIEAAIMDMDEIWFDDDDTTEFVYREVDEESIARMIHILRTLARSTVEVAGYLWFYFDEEDGTEWEMSLDRWSNDR